MSANVPTTPNSIESSQEPAQPVTSTSSSSKTSVSAAIEATQEPVIPNNAASYFIGSVGPATPSYDQKDYGW